jgi:hypothetical protein
LIPFPAALDAYDDPRLHDLERRIYRVALISLDFHSFRPFKLAYLKEKTGRPAAELCAARNRLVDAGYLDRAEAGFRLVLSLPDRGVCPAFIYGLFDPREPERLRYIGRTVDLDSRLSGHRFNGVPRVRDWVRQLASEGQRPAMRCIEECSTDEAPAREVFWIRGMRDLGHADLNSHVPAA